MEKKVRRKKRGGGGLLLIMSLGRASSCQTMQLVPFNLITKTVGLVRVTEREVGGDKWFLRGSKAEKRHTAQTKYIVT